VEGVPVYDEPKKTPEDRGPLGDDAVNVPLGYFLSTVVFSRFWSNISSLM
jgi:hypothetical protein